MDLNSRIVTVPVSFSTMDLVRALGQLSINDQVDVIKLVMHDKPQLEDQLVAMIVNKLNERAKNQLEAK